MNDYTPPIYIVEVRVIKINDLLGNNTEEMFAEQLDSQSQDGDCDRALALFQKVCENFSEG